MSYPEYACASNHVEEIAEEIVQKVSGALSLMGSTCIVVDVVRKLLRRHGHTDAYQRIMLGLSFFDMTHSFFDSFMGSWMVPRETGWLGASGNTASCAAQGFFTALGFFGSFGYQMALSLNLLLLICSRWSQNKFARRIEKPIHACIILIALAWAIIPLPMQGYNADCGQCIWIPLYDASGNVVRGSSKLQHVYWVIFFSHVWLMIIFCTVAMVCVYITVRRQEDKQKKYVFSSCEQNNHKKSQRIGKIMILYTMALLFCWGVPYSVIVPAYMLDAWPSKIPFGIRILVEALIPLLGVFNCLVYFLPKCLKHQEKNPEVWLVAAYFHVMGCGCHATVCRTKDDLVEEGRAKIDDAEYSEAHRINATLCRILKKSKMTEEGQAERNDPVRDEKYLEVSGIGA
ncbi:hypothetical protein ACHAWF_014923 [Thalassiosira exigua]